MRSLAIPWLWLNRGSTEYLISLPMKYLNLLWAHLSRTKSCLSIMHRCVHKTIWKLFGLPNKYQLFQSSIDLLFFVVFICLFLYFNTFFRKMGWLLNINCLILPMIADYYKHYQCILSLTCFYTWTLIFFFLWIYSLVMTKFFWKTSSVRDSMSSPIYSGYLLSLLF